MNLEEKNTSNEAFNASVQPTANTSVNNAGSTKNVVSDFANKSFGKFKGLHIMLAACGLVVLVILCLVIGMGGKKEVAYPAIYSNSDGDLMLFAPNVKKEEKAVKLANLDSGERASSVVQFANNTDRYVLFEKNDDLYLYDSKKKNDTTKIVSNNYTAGFTDNDKYVVALNTDDNLYVYSFGKSAEKLDSDVSSIKTVSNEKVIYVKDGNLYIKSLNPKKDDREKITDELGSGTVRITEDSKYVFFVNKDKDLYIYNVAKKSKDKIAKNVTKFYESEKGNKLYYITTTEDDGKSYSNIEYYDGKKSEKVAEKVYDIEAIDIDKQMVVYTTRSEKNYKYTLHFVKGTKESVEIEDGMESLGSVRIYQGKAIYYINGDDEVKYAKISGNKVGTSTTLAEDAKDGYLYNCKSGVAFVGDVDKSGLGTLYIASGAKAKKIDSDVSENLRISNDGSKVYYVKDQKTKTGDLYVTSGGKGKKIESDVYSFTYVKDNLIYILKDVSSSGKGDLYRYTGKSVKIAEDVTSVASTPNHYEAK